jgi:hypothetical protein
MTSMRDARASAGHALKREPHGKYFDTIPEYARSLRAGDTDTVAHILHEQRYYNGSESVYKNNMKANKRTIDAKLGPVPNAPSAQLP